MLTIATSFLWVVLGLSFIAGGHSLAVLPVANNNSQAPAPSQQLLILGLGKVGLEVARQAAALTPPSQHFRSVAGTVRDTTLTNDNGMTAIQRIPCHLSDILPRLAETSHVLVTIPAIAVGEAQDDEGGLNAIFDAIVQGLKPGCWLGLISTTGVYGNYDGEWVTEESECRSQADTTASQFLEYEAAWCRRATNHGHHLSIFRCAGIYGPTRSALHTVFQKGVLVSTPNSSSDNDKATKILTNRIHEHDLAASVVASMNMNMNMLLLEKDDPLPACAIYNLADNQPESRSVVLEYATNLLKSIHVPLETRTSMAKETSVRSRRRQTDQKRVSNQKMKDLLLPRLLYPTYKEGLETILNDPASPWQQN